MAASETTGANETTGDGVEVAVSVVRVPNRLRGRQDLLRELPHNRIAIVGLRARRVRSESLSGPDDWRTRSVLNPPANEQVGRAVLNLPADEPAGRGTLEDRPANEQSGRVVEDGTADEQTDQRNDALQERVPGTNNGE
ncbi:hypothetical protein ON010_g2546 [Phytophthora cinnamomi]|nr:hypothetical protein ON010_g2546 [Phytophthora cinnamomi]